MEKVNLDNQIKTLYNLRKEIGMNRREFSEYMGIPLRTMEEWEAGRRKMPDYVLRLISYQIKMELYLQKKSIDATEVMQEVKEWSAVDGEK